MGQILPWAPIVISAIMLWVAIDARKHSRQDKGVAERQTLKDDVAGIKTGLAVLEARFEDFLQIPIRRGVRKLTSPHTPVLDVLLRKFQEDAFDDENEIYQLKVLLQEIRDTDIEQERREQAENLLTLVRNRYEVGKELLKMMAVNDAQSHLN